MYLEYVMMEYVMHEHVMNKYLMLDSLDLCKAFFLTNLKKMIYIYI
jgi:hypothetical protein